MSQHSNGTSALSTTVIDTEVAVQSVRTLSDIVVTLRSSVFKDTVDYGTIPGTNDKPTLLLPGMEKLMRALQLRPIYELVSAVEDFSKPLFFYRYQCSLVEIETGLVIATAIGSANSMENKWAWRWVSQHDVPGHLDITKLKNENRTISEFDFAVQKGETTGQYGKPAEYWQQFHNAIANKTARKITKITRSGKAMDAWEIGGMMYRVPNPDIFDQVNTIDKIAQKRALGSAIKGAANVSEFFTVDLEDLTIHRPSDIIEADFTVANSETTTAPDTSTGQGNTQPPQTTDPKTKYLKSYPPDHWLVGNFDKFIEKISENARWVHRVINQRPNPEKMTPVEISNTALGFLKAQSWQDYPSGLEAVQALVDAVMKFNQPAQPSHGNGDGLFGERNTPSWPNQEGIDRLLATLRGQGYTNDEITRASGVGNATDMSDRGWGKYASFRDAKDRITGLLEAMKKDQPIDDSLKRSVYEGTYGVYGYMVEEDDAAWQARWAAINDVDEIRQEARRMAIANQSTVKIETIRFVDGGKGRQYLDLLCDDGEEAGGITIRAYGRDHLRVLDKVASSSSEFNWTQFADNLKPSEDTKLPEPLYLAQGKWKEAGSTHPYFVTTPDGGFNVLLFERYDVNIYIPDGDIPF